MSWAAAKKASRSFIVIFDGSTSPEGAAEEAPGAGLGLGGAAAGLGFGGEDARDFSGVGLTGDRGAVGGSVVEAGGAVEETGDSALTTGETELPVAATAMGEALESAAVVVSGAVEAGVGSGSTVPSEAGAGTEGEGS